MATRTANGDHGGASGPSARPPPGDISAARNLAWADGELDPVREGEQPVNRGVLTLEKAGVQDAPGGVALGRATVSKWEGREGFQ